MKQELKMDFSITGLILAVVFIAFISVVSMTFMAEMESEYPSNGTATFDKYNKTQALLDQTEKFRNTTNIKQQEGLVDVVGGFFSSGYSALKITGSSIDLSTDMIQSATNDVESAGTFQISTFMIIIILIIVFVGVFIAVLVKWRI